jgi:uncharacterized membrane protein SpoIIM required for sporulation
MREAAFIKQNMSRWQEFEKLLQDDALSPEKKSEIFIQLTDDLSFAQTQYPSSETTTYLNHLSAKIHQQIYKNKKEDRSRFLTFWTHELPGLFFSLRRSFLYSLLITLLATGIGVISALGDDTFNRLILGDGYVNMTLENISRGNPFGVYGSQDATTMFFLITFNNIRVSFIVFAAGVILSVGSGYVLFNNGIMLGAFFALFYQHHALLDSILVVMLHGTLEISAIIIAGGAGIRMGNSILFPGTYSRLESFKSGARDGIKVVMGLMPVFILAGFIESFVTRHSEMPAFAKVVIIGISLIFIMFYFFVYPAIYNKQDHVSKN